MKRTEERFGFQCTTPPLGPFMVNSDLGMKAAIAILDRSLDKGAYGPHVQWATFRKLMSGITNTLQASVGGLGNSVGHTNATNCGSPQPFLIKFGFQGS